MTDRDKYYHIIQEIENAGFFVTKVEQKSGFNRITVVTKKREEGGFSGNSFWISKLGNQWYFGTWGGCLYEVPQENVVAEFVIQWFSKEPDRTCSDFADEIKKEYKLRHVTEKEFDAAVSRENG